MNPSTTTTYSFNAVDSAYNPFSVCSSTNSITVYPTPSIFSPSVRPTQSRQTATTMNDVVSGGSGTFAFGNTLNNAQFTATLVGSNGISNALSNPTAGTFVYNVIATDMGTTTHYVISQETNTLTVTTSYVQPSVTQPIASNTAVDVGQYATFTATITPGSPNYIGNLLTTNAGKVTNTIAVPSQGGTALSTTFYIGSNQVSSFTANYVLWDAHPTEFNSIASAAVSAYAAQTSLLLLKSNTVIDQGQVSRITATSTGGAGTITYNYFSGASCTNANYLGTGTSLLVNPSSTTSYSFNAVDQATTPNSVCSGTNTITVDTDPTVTLYPPTNSIDTTQSVIFTNTVSNGDAPFTYAYTVNSMSGVSEGDIIDLHVQQCRNVQCPAHGHGQYRRRPHTLRQFAGDCLCPTLTTPASQFQHGAGRWAILHSHRHLEHAHRSAAISGEIQELHQTSESVMTIHWSHARCQTLTQAAGLAGQYFQYFFLVEDSSQAANAIMDSATENMVVNNAQSSLLLLESNTVIDAGQYSRLTASSNRGIGFDNLQLLLSLRLPGGLLCGAGGEPAGESWLYRHLFLQCSRSGPTTPNSVCSSPTTLTVNALPSISILPTAATISTGGSVLFTNSTSGGTGPFTFAYTYSPGTGVVRSGNSFQFNTAGTYNLFEKITDSVGNSASSTNAVITVFSMPSTPTISNPTNTLVDVGQTETFNAFVSGGSPPYTYYFFVANTAALSPYTEYPTSANYVTFRSVPLT